MYAVTSVGQVIGGLSDPDDGEWEQTTAVIRLDGTQFTTDVVAGLEDFTHLEVVYVFDQVDPAMVVTTADRPHGREDWPLVGVFAHRCRARPNRIGVSRCRIMSIDGLDVKVAGLDAIHGTPILDLKPWVEEYGPVGDTRQPEWALELMLQR